MMFRNFLPEYLACVPHGKKTLIRKLSARKICFITLVCAPRQEACERSVVQEEVLCCFYFIGILFNFRNLNSASESSSFWLPALWQESMVLCVSTSTWVWGTCKSHKSLKLASDCWGKIGKSAHWECVREVPIKVCPAIRSHKGYSNFAF